MNENILSFVKWGAGIAITLAIISIAMIMFNSSKDAAQEGIDDINSTNKTISESEFSKYNGGEVSGSEVSSCIEKYADEYMAISVSNGGSTIWYGYSATTNASSGTANMGSKTTNTIAITKDVKTSSYINPNGTFDASIYRDENDVISAIVFVQN